MQAASISRSIYTLNSDIESINSILYVQHKKAIDNQMECPHDSSLSNFFIRRKVKLAAHMHIQ
jgi:hypothetical protein